MEKFKIPAKDGIKLISAEIIDNCIVATYEEIKKLRLEVNKSNYLSVMYGNERVGHITDRGECIILSLKNHRETYLEWVTDGMPLDHSEVKWRGKMYSINLSFYFGCTPIAKYAIFNFRNGVYCTYCKDENIQRYPHNLTPIAY